MIMNDRNIEVKKRAEMQKNIIAIVNISIES